MPKGAAVEEFAGLVRALKARDGRSYEALGRRLSVSASASTATARARPSRRSSPWSTASPCCADEGIRPEERVICHAPGQVLELLVRAGEPSESQLFPEPATRRPGGTELDGKGPRDPDGSAVGEGIDRTPGSAPSPVFAGVSEDGRDHPRGSGSEPPRT